mmetsp:Transcript_12542/g.30843  ORF Transcript_12542/g.30843 Transcript_12542/m.30843 type:complete len:270 (-) Transcript_12542:387-1196(-)
MRAQRCTPTTALRYLYVSVSIVSSVSASAATPRHTASVLSAFCTLLHSAATASRCACHSLITSGTSAMEVTLSELSVDASSCGSHDGVYVCVTVHENGLDVSSDSVYASVMSTSNANVTMRSPYLPTARFARPVRTASVSSSPNTRSSDWPASCSVFASVMYAACKPFLPPAFVHMPAPAGNGCRQKSVSGPTLYVERSLLDTPNVFFMACFTLRCTARVHCRSRRAHDWSPGGRYRRMSGTVPLGTDTTVGASASAVPATKKCSVAST